MTFKWKVLEVLLLGVLNYSGGPYKLIGRYKYLFKCD